MQTATILSEGPQITAADLDLELPEGATHVRDAIVSLSVARERWQRDYINHALTLNDGNRTQTARDLGVDPRTIFRHLEREEGRSKE